MTTTALKKQRAEITAVLDEGPKPSPYLARVLEEVERATVIREKMEKRSSPATQRTPPPFAYD